MRSKRNLTRMIPMLAVLLALSAQAPAAQVSVTTLNPTDDSYVGARGKSKGASKKLLAGSAYTGLLRFDLSAIPSTAVVREAKLRLFLLGVKPKRSTAAIDVRQIDTAWDEDSVTTTSKPNVSTIVDDSRSANVAQRFDYVVWDVTALTQYMVTNGGANQGFALSGSGAIVSFCSLEGRCAAPQLQIAYESNDGNVVEGPMGPTGPAGRAGRDRPDGRCRPDRRDRQ
jgi:hypothetical protein